MAIYIYKCIQCGTVELNRSVYDVSTPACPQCNSENIARQYSNVGVVFKGKGFYRTDSRGLSGKDK
jgi:putative FmdB family regulatory protein